MTSDTERGEILRAVARKTRLASVPVREALFKAVDYRRVMDAAVC
ncbi:MAG: hypothetical protein ACXW0Z_12075 [Gemmatirosa sp.]